MLARKPTVFISHSERFKERVAVPFRDYAESLGMNAILVSEMPTPEHGATTLDARLEANGSADAGQLLKARVVGEDPRSRPKYFDIPFSSFLPAPAGTTGCSAARI